MDAAPISRRRRDRRAEWLLSLPTLAGLTLLVVLPTLLVFVDGSLAGRIVGARGRRHLDEEIERITSSVPVDA